MKILGTGRKSFPDGRQLEAHNIPRLGYRLIPAGSI